MQLAKRLCLPTPKVQPPRLRVVPPLPKAPSRHRFDERLRNQWSDSHWLEKRYNHIASVDKCPLCGALVDCRIGMAYFLDDTWEPVCSCCTGQLIKEGVPVLCENTVDY